MLQPLDVSINKPMKAAMRQKWSHWMATGEKSFTAGGRRRAPDLVTVCQWIMDAWRELDPTIITRAFKKCCISNILDGAEDDILWCEEEPDELDRELMTLEVKMTMTCCMLMRAATA